MTKIIHLLLFFIFSISIQAQNTGNTLALRFENLPSTGIIRLALYSDAEHFMDEQKAVLYNFEVKKAGNLEASIEGLPHGEYAFAAFLDENKNRELDKNLFGVPTEAYGFSNNPKAKWGLPSFEEARFKVGGSLTLLTVQLQKWKL